MKSFESAFPVYGSALFSGELKIVKIDKKTNERLAGVKLEASLRTDSVRDTINYNEVINRILRFPVIQY